LDQVPLVDFCNQLQSTSTTTGSTDPRSELVDAAPPACAGLGGEPPDGVEAIRHADHRIRVVLRDADARPSLSTRTCCRLKASRRLHPTRRAPPAEVSRARGRRALAVRHLPSGPPRVRDARGAGSAALLRDAGSPTRASPQPDPLGHLMSRDRGAPAGEPDAKRPPRQLRRAGAVRLRRSRRANPALTRERGSVRLTWPRHAPLSQRANRGPRAASPGPPRRGSEIGCTRGAFHR